MRRVVFVDDESFVLDGIRRMLRHYRKKWDMEFFSDGESALKAIESRPCDVIVSDIQMPGLDGITLLSIVNEKFPDTVRIALSGQTDPQLIYQCIEHSHQYLSKPCEADQLIETIDRGCNLHKLLSDDHLKALINKMSSVPTVPSSYQRIKAELQAEEVDITAIGKIVNEDPAISMQILKIVNSAYFGLARKISTPLEATIYLGADVIHSLVLANSVFSQFSEQTVQKLNLASVWESSLRTYSLAKTIARDQSDDDLLTSYASTGGLLIDIGTLVLCSEVPEKMQAMVAQQETSGQPLWQIEAQNLGFSHMEVGAYIAALWGLPNPIVEAIAFHHCPQRSGTTLFSPLTAVHIANAIVQSADADDLQEYDADYVETVGVTDAVAGWRANYGNAQQ
jgi:HD-like signal output (HDOD) protein